MILIAEQLGVEIVQEFLFVVFLQIDFFYQYNILHLVNLFE